MGGGRREGEKRWGGEREGVRAAVEAGKGRGKPPCRVRQTEATPAVLQTCRTVGWKGKKREVGRGVSGIGWMPGGG